MAIKSKDEVNAKGQAPGGRKNLRYENFPWARIKKKIVNAGGGVVLVPPSGEFALNFDGFNDGVISDPTHTQWELTQPWTFFVNFHKADNGYQGFFDTRLLGGGGLGVQGLYIWLESFGGTNYVIVTMVGANGSRLQVFPLVTIPGVFKGTLQVTYTGGGTVGSLRCYLNGIDMGGLGQTGAGVNGTIINADNIARVGRVMPGHAFGPAAGARLTGRIRALSFIDYVKTPAEILADHVAGIQSVGTGNYLFSVDHNVQTGLVYLTNDGLNLPMNINGQAFGDWVLR